MKASARAANPARLTFSMLQYFRCYPGMLLTPVGAFAFAVILALLKGISIEESSLIGVAVGAISLPVIASSLKQRMLDGNLCAAVVISTSPYAVAVLADLSNGLSGPKLAVKIKTAPLEKMAGGAPKLGARLAASSIYFGQAGTGSWKDFNPLMAPCACADQAQLERALYAIDANDWLILDEAMKSLNPRAFGLHHLQT